MPDLIEEKYGKIIEDLHTKINDLSSKLINSSESEKKSIYLSLKNDYHELRISYGWMVNPDPIITRSYENAIKRAYCHEIYFYRKYLYTQNEDQNFNEFLQFVNLVYDYFFIKEFEVEIEFRNAMIDLIGRFDAKITIIIDGLNKAIDIIQNNFEFKKNSFEYYNTLGDLIFEKYLLLTIHAEHETEIIEEFLIKSIRYYNLANQYSKKSGHYRNVAHLPIFDDYRRDNAILNFLDVKSKIKVLHNKFPDYF